MPGFLYYRLVYDINQMGLHSNISSSDALQIVVLGGVEQCVQRLCCASHRPVPATHSVAPTKQGSHGP
jgi:hypothetical protein